MSEGQKRTTDVFINHLYIYSFMLVYQVASREMKIGKNKGNTMYYAKPIEARSLSREAIETQIVEKTLMSRGDIRLALTSFAETICWALSEGLNVDLGDLGTFKVEAFSKFEANEQNVSASSLRKPRVRFFPRKKLTEAARRVSISVKGLQGTTERTSTSESTGSGTGTSTSGSGAGTTL